MSSWFRRLTNLVENSDNMNWKVHEVARSLHAIDFALPWSHLTKGVVTIKTLRNFETFKSICMFGGALSSQWGHKSPHVVDLSYFTLGNIRSNMDHTCFVMPISTPFPHDAMMIGNLHKIFQKCAPHVEGSTVPCVKASWHVYLVLLSKVTKFCVWCNFQCKLTFLQKKCEYMSSCCWVKPFLQTMWRIRQRRV